MFIFFSEFHDANIQTLLKLHPELLPEIIDVICKKKYNSSMCYGDTEK